jgi:uncharacterized membrane protein (Fun14 family)
MLGQRAMTPRNRRFAMLLIASIGKVLAILAGGIAVGFLIGYALLWLGYAYGMKPVLIGLFVLWVMCMATVIGGGMASRKLNELERQERETLRRLRDV